MKTVNVPENYQHTSPAGAEVRVLMSDANGGIAHCTLRKNKISKAVRHKTVSEFWHILSEKGAIWRRDKTGESILPWKLGLRLIFLSVLIFNTKAAIAISFLFALLCHLGQDQMKLLMLKRVHGNLLKPEFGVFVIASASEATQVLLPFK
jgi:hypothetical protein